MQTDEVDEFLWTQVNDFKSERRIYYELFSLYKVTTLIDHGQTSEHHLWDELNALVDRLQALSHDYSRFKIEGQHRHQLSGTWVSSKQLQSNCLRMLSLMSQEFDFEDPHDRLARLTPNGVASINNRVESRSDSKAEAHISLELEIEKLSFALGSTLDENDKEKVAPALEELKKQPTKQNVSKLIAALKSLGSASSNAALGVLAEMALKLALGLPPL